MDAPTRASRPSPGQRALADALARGEAAMGNDVARLPASVYIDPERYVLEQETLFEGLPLLLAPSAMLAADIRGYP